ncbi:Uncharacterized protein PECH_008180 [Penicillium ucsense]|uniref:Uncharacterized protein n=1 Tax=Penicillium ucsense TaxID=2839758 RepID=A0A8J8VY21_9EURO|nr:Uncharacterized protein PECM_000609 [Penicillium ucsense]KAF7734384.1 Uncharacterized protein PECH_008180 [Penicillium ucsense]
MRRKQLKSESTSPFSYSSSSSASRYPSSLSSNSDYSDSIFSGSRSRSSSAQPRDHLDHLILKHGYPTPVSLSSLRDLTATSSAYNPPTSTHLSSAPHSRPPPRRSESIPFDPVDALALSASSTRPIPIPRRRIESDYDDHLPVTPLTGRFDHDDYIEDWERASLSARSRHLRSPPPSSRTNRHRSAPTAATVAAPTAAAAAAAAAPTSSRHHSHRYSSMRADHSPFYSPVASPTMSPRRPSSPQPPRSRGQNTPTKAIPGFSLGSLPRFHPAVYQSKPTSHASSGQPPSPRQSRQQAYRTSSGSRDMNMKWQYGTTLMDAATQSPSAPRLDPLLSPGPVTPLALESADYLTAGHSGTTTHGLRDGAGQHSSPSADLVDKLIARENEKARQKSRQTAKGR